MRLTTVRTGSGLRAGRVDGEQVTLLPFSDVGALLSVADWEEAALAAGETIAEATAQRAALVPSPNKIICVGLNYESHIREMGHERPTFPTLFAKFSAALIGARDPIEMPESSTRVDWEAELGVVVGKAGRFISEESALEHIAGYCVVNDVTARDWQRRTSEFLQGKTFEATTPVGPDLVTADELPAGGLGLSVRCEVDGEVVQFASTADLCFSPAALVSYISQIITLLPGDLISTGTPGGVGDGRDPQRYLAPGMTVRTSIDGVGELVNICH